MFYIRIDVLYLNVLRFRAKYLRYLIMAFNIFLICTLFETKCGLSRLWRLIFGQLYTFMDTCSVFHPNDHVFIHSDPIKRHVGASRLTLILVIHQLVISPAQHNQYQPSVSLVQFKAMTAPGAILQPQNVECFIREGPTLSSCAIQCLESPTECLLIFVELNQCYLCTLKSQVSASEPLRSATYFLNKKALLGRPLLHCNIHINIAAHTHTYIW